METNPASGRGRRLANLCLVVLVALAAACAAGGAPDRAEFEPQARVVAIGDVHGDYERFVQILRDADLVGADLRWSGGATHLVQLGDIPDRGPDTLRIIRLLQGLEKQARRARGAVHCLIGNHEAMNMYGDLRYVHPDEYAAFVTKDSARLQEFHYKAGVALIKASVPEAEWPAFDEQHRTAWLEKHPPGFVEHAEAWDPKGVIGRWILTHNAVLRIGDTLFVHGGFGPGYVGLGIDEINTAVRRALRKPEAVNGTIVRDENGPLWYRGLAQHPELLERPHLEELLAHFKARRIVIGHTPMPGAVVPRFGGRVILVDVGISQVYGGTRACLLIEDGTAFALHHGTKLELPTGGPAEVINYLRKVSALDPDSKPILRLIRTLDPTRLEEPHAAPGAEERPVEADAP